MGNRMLTQNIKLEYVLASRNVNNRIYMCDIYRYFGWDLGREKASELRESLEKI